MTLPEGQTDSVIAEAHTDGLTTYLLGLQVILRADAGGWYVT